MHAYSFDREQLEHDLSARLKCFDTNRTKAKEIDRKEERGEKRKKA